MRCAPSLAAVLGMGLLLSACVHSMRGNDTGGIIPYSPENRAAAFAIASEHCARYNKYARLNSVHAQYGDYIGFSCVWSPYARP